MTKQEALLQSIAESGYNTGISAKRHFKSYDILRLGPKCISVFTISIGIFQMTELYKGFSKANSMYSDLFSAILIIIGIWGLVADCCSTNKDKYNCAGIQLIHLFNELHVMFNKAKAMNEDDDFTSFYGELNSINQKSSDVALSEQIIFSGWLSHLGFFGGEVQIDWINEQLKLGLSDKVPISFRIFIVVLVILFLGYLKITA